MSANASWSVDQDLAKAKAYVVAATIWLDKFAFDQSVAGPSQMRFDRLNAGLQERLKEAQNFVRASQPALPASGSVVGLSVRDFR